LLSVPSASGGSATYEWSDRNGDRYFQDGEQTRLISTSVLTNPVWDPSEFVDSERKNPYTDSYQLGFDWELTSNIALSVVGTYKIDKDLTGNIVREVPYSAYNPHSVINPLDGQPMTIYLLDPAYRGITRRNWSTTIPSLKREYKGVGLVFKRRFDGKSQFSVSSDLGRAEGHVGTAFSQPSNWGDPNAFINAYGPTDMDATGVLKAQGTYVAWGVMFSGSYLFNSGFPLGISVGGGPAGARIARFVRGVDYPATAIEPNLDIPVEPRGTTRQDVQSTFSLRVEKKINLGRGRLGLLLDVMNLFNSSSLLVAQSLRLDAPNFLQPEVINQPRSARVGIRYDF
jgi:hypothetical protein